ncbi:MAG: hypothetical protein H6807_09330 [Planctomycetes bacterium]|nr:hypothetical protein [Planctomycetota bacterium]
MNEAKKPGLWRRLASFWPVPLVFAILMIGRNPMAASPGDPPDPAAGQVYDISFSPL